MGHLCLALQKQGALTLVSSSGGNAGLSCAMVCAELGIKVQVVVPETTKQIVIKKLQSLGADVQVHGENWNAADLLAREIVASTEGAAYISPYDDPLLWTGHSTLIDEIFEDLGEQTPTTIIVSVGGGGLICGTLEGLERLSLTTTVVAAETQGASSFGQAWVKGELVRLDGIHSVATSLGALEVTPVSLERSRKHQQRGGTVQEAISTDAEAVDACLQFARDHRILVEPACGAALAVAYSKRLREKLLKDINGPVVIEVCGGSGVSLDLLSQWKKDILGDE
jgi:L-serine/L-threonine ammonia-lyase